MLRENHAIKLNQSKALPCATNVMADSVDNDACSYIGKSISTNTKQIDLAQTNHHHQQQQRQPSQQKQQQHRHHAHQQLDDDDHINKPISTSTDVSNTMECISS